MSVQFPSPFPCKDPWHWVYGPPQSSVTSARTLFSKDVTLTGPGVMTPTASTHLPGGHNSTPQWALPADGTSWPLSPTTGHNKLPESLSSSKELVCFRVQGTGGYCLCPVLRPLPHSTTWIYAGDSSPLGLGLGVGPGLSPPKHPSPLPEGLSMDGHVTRLGALDSRTSAGETGGKCFLLLHVKQQRSEPGPAGEPGWGEPT